MSKAEKFFLTLIVFLVLVVALVLVVPDRTLQKSAGSVPQLLSKLGKEASAMGRNAANSIQAGFSQSTRKLRPPSSSGSAPNPVDSAVGPAAGYGNAQKDVYGRPVDALNR